MASATPAAAIEARLAANWTTTPIEYENDGEFVRPTDGSGAPLPFVGLEYPGGVARQMSIGNPGNNAWEEVGVFLLHILIQAGNRASVATAKTYADQLAVIFRGQEFGFVICYAPGPPIATDPPDGNYYRLSVSVPYRFQYLA